MSIFRVMRIFFQPVINAGLQLPGKGADDRFVENAFVIAGDLIVDDFPGDELVPAEGAVGFSAGRLLAGPENDGIPIITRR